MTNPFDKYGSPEGNVFAPGDLDVGASTEIVCRDIMDRMLETYPGFNWAIQPDDRGGIFNVFCMDLHDGFGYTIRMVDVINDPRRKEAVRAAGEILDRFGYKFKKYGKTTFNLQYLTTIRKDARGRCVPDLGHTKPSNVSRQVKRQQLRQLQKKEILLSKLDGEY